MKYRKDGRVYRLRCPLTKSCIRFPDCTERENPHCKNQISETLPSKIRGWLRGDNVKYQKDGRVYKLVPFRGDCTECAFHNQSCEYLPSCDHEGRGAQAMWRETIPSKIRGWLRRMK